MTLTVDRRENLPHAAFVKDYLEPRRPVILTDAARGWPALRWTPDYFHDHFGDVKVTRAADSARTRPMIGDRKYSMRDFVAAVAASKPDNPGPYMTGFSVRSVPKMARDLLPEHKYLSGNWLASRLLPASTIDLLFGPPGGRIAYMHRDRMHHHSFTTMTHGVKRFIFYSPDQASLMYPREGLFLRCKSSIDDPEKPDLKKYPDFAKAIPMICDLAAGETLFIPAGWWHFTRILETAINFRHCFVNENNCDDMIDELSNQVRETGPFAPVGGAPVDSPIYPGGLFLAGLIAVRALKRRQTRKYSFADARHIEP